MNFSIYDNTGVFVGNLFSPYASDAELMVQLVGAAGFVQGDYDAATRWYDRSTDQVLLRQSLPVHLDGMRLLGVPAGAIVSIQGASHIADGSEIDLSFDQPGHYEIKVSQPPFLPFESSIDYENSH
ncbi:hypothetical protein FHW84_002069 [Dyella sp. SG562]|uniref:hypothetical protein n=1 Tax=Dyella sp. SG562 TaxID=2587017 RepID=UPI0014227AD7|nr:hypothetical protein [Dyella sp. SG562]NII73497.1 hypothetical protein [Dyella sp. SG562]